MTGQREHELTRRQAMALRIFTRNGELNEGLLAEEGWPVVRNARLVANGLVAKGLVTFGGWWDEGVGYELHLTPRGRELADDLAKVDGP